MTDRRSAQSVRRLNSRTSRRELMLLLGGAMTAARTLRAQQKAEPVVGFLSSRSPGEAATVVAAFHQGLAGTGYVEEQNLAIEYRWAEGRYDRLPALAADLVGRKVDVIVATGAPLRQWRQKAQRRRSRSSSSAAIRSNMASSLVSPGRAATPRASASLATSCCPNGSNCYRSWFPRPG